MLLIIGSYNKKVIIKQIKLSQLIFYLALILSQESMWYSGISGLRSYYLIIWFGNKLIMAKEWLTLLMLGKLDCVVKMWLKYIDGFLIDGPFMI